MAETLRLHIEVDVFSSENNLPAAESALMDRAREVAGRVYAPYSGFLVGAGLLLKDSSIHTGNNEENAAYPSGLCAERTTLFGLRCKNAETPITLIAVTTRRVGDTLFLPAR
jgi:cytidine deaminase